MRLLIDDLKRRKPFKVGVIYGVCAIALLLLAQVVLFLTGAPEWALNLVVATLFIPFPFVVILTWAITAEPPENVKAGARRRRPTLYGGPPGAD